jgi:signal transduction histidine kinase
MNGFSIAGLFFVAIPAIIVGPFVLIKGRKMVHLTWSAFLTGVCIWGVGMYKIGTATNPESSLFWWRFAEIGVILIPVFLVHFVISFLGLKRKIFLLISYSIAGAFLYLDIFTNYLIHDLYFAFNQFYYIKSTPFYTALICLFVASVIYVIYELNRLYEKSQGIIRSQIKYLILALFIGFGGGVTSFPAVYGIDEIYPVWNATIFISSIMISYAILRYRLMDIRIVVRRFVVYAGMAGVVYGAFYLVNWVYGIIFGGIYNSKAYLSGLIVAPLFVGVFLLIGKLLRSFANKYLFFSLYSYQETISKLTSELNYNINLDKIVNSIVDTIKKTMNLDRAGVLLVSKDKNKIHYKIAKVIGFDESNGISLVQDNFLTRHLERTQIPLVREELGLLSRDSKSKSDTQSFEKLSSNMERIEASLCLPLISGSKLIGIIVLGTKASGDAYSREDLNLLDTLSKQAAIAIENAMLYKQVQDFSKTLQQKVDEQTKEIRQQKDKVEKSYKVEKQAHEELKKLNEAKTQFSLAAQHHLRTPLTSMNGYLDLLLGGSYGKIPKKVKDILVKFNDSTQNEIKIVNELLDISQFQMGKEVVFINDDVKVEDIIKEAVGDVALESKNKGIYIKTDIPKKLPIIKADLKKLKMAVYNIIDNAVKYTNKGGVDIKVEINDNKLLITIKDTGAGIPKEHQKDLFNKLFERSKEAEKMFATGRGIGLWITYRIIDGHKGKIWAESAGEDKGSTFFIELPITN